MKTEQEIREELEKLRKDLNEEEMPGIIGLIKFERIYALKWALEDKNENTLAK